MYGRRNGAGVKHSNICLVIVRVTVKRNVAICQFFLKLSRMQASKFACFAKRIPFLLEKKHGQLQLYIPTG